MGDARHPSLTEPLEVARRTRLEEREELEQRERGECRQQEQRDPGHDGGETSTSCGPHGADRHVERHDNHHLGHDEPDQGLDQSSTP